MNVQSRVASTTACSRPENPGESSSSRPGGRRLVSASNSSTYAAVAAVVRALSQPINDDSNGPLIISPPSTPNQGHTDPSSDTAAMNWPMATISPVPTAASRTTTITVASIQPGHARHITLACSQYRLMRPIRCR